MLLCSQHPSDTDAKRTTYLVGGDEKGRWMVPASAKESVGYFFFSLKKCFCLCMSALPASCLRTTCAQCSRRPEEGARSPGADVADGTMRVLWIEPLGRPAGALCHLSSPSSLFSLGFPWSSVSVGSTILLSVGIEMHLSPLSPFDWGEGRKAKPFFGTNVYWLGSCTACSYVLGTTVQLHLHIFEHITCVSVLGGCQIAWTEVTVGWLWANCVGAGNQIPFLCSASS